MELEEEQESLLEDLGRLESLQRKDELRSLAKIRWVLGAVALLMLLLGFWYSTWFLAKPSVTSR